MLVEGIHSIRAPRDRVWASLNDPLILAELSQLRGKLNEYGYTKIYSGELFHGALFEKEIRRLHREEENPKIVLVGYSFGAGVVDGIAERLSFLE